MLEKITLVSVTVPRLHNLQNLIPRALPHIDRCVLICGRDDPETFNYLKTLGSKIEYYYYPWKDNFAQQYTNMFHHIDDGWVLTLDDDEMPSEEMLTNLRKLVKESANGEKYSVVAFRANPISEGQDLGPCNYWRQMLFKYSNGMHYRGGPKTGCHQYLVGHQNNRCINVPFTYYHIKSLKDEYRNASRNYFIYGIWPHGSSEGIQTEEWQELKKILSEVYPEVKYFPDLDKILIQGDVHLALKEWMVKWFNHYAEHPNYNEMRALPIYYFVDLHPEESRNLEIKR